MDLPSYFQRRKLDHSVAIKEKTIQFYNLTTFILY